MSLKKKEGSYCTHNTPTGTPALHFQTRQHCTRSPKGSHNFRTPPSISFFVLCTYVSPTHNILSKIVPCPTAFCVGELPTRELGGHQEQSNATHKDDSSLLSTTQGYMQAGIPRRDTRSAIQKFEIGIIAHHTPHTNRHRERERY